MKQRTSIAMDERVRRAAERAARARGVSLSRYITEVLEAHLADLPQRRFTHSVEITTSVPIPAARDHDRLLFRQ